MVDGKKRRIGAAGAAGGLEFKVCRDSVAGMRCSMRSFAPALLTVSLALLACGGDGGGSAGDGDGDGSPLNGDGDAAGDGDGDAPLVPIQPAQIFARFGVIAEGEGEIRVTGQLNIDTITGPSVELTGGDRLVVSAAGSSTEMTMRPVGEMFMYEADIPDGGEGLRVDIALERGEVGESATGSYGTLPGPFSMVVLGIEHLGEFPRGQDIQLTWTPARDGEMNYSLTGTCIEDVIGRAPDSGAFTIAAAEVIATEGNEGESCGLLLSLIRFGEGVISEAFDGGIVQAMQARSIAFRSTPAEN